MDITPTTRTVIDYHLTLSAEDAQACIDKPWDFGEALAEQLRAAGLGKPVAAANGNGTGQQHNRVHLQLGKGKRGRKPGRAPKAPKAGTHRPAKFACPSCSKKFTSQVFLSRHEAMRHSTSSATADDVK